MSNQFEIVDSPARPALAVHEDKVPVDEIAQHVGMGFGAVMRRLGGLGEAPAGGPFVGYLSMGPDGFDMEIGFPTHRELPGEGDVIATTIPGGRRAVAMHQGPYENLGATYEAVQTWLAGQGETLAGATYEYYLNAPDEVPPSELLTRIELLLA